MLTTKNSLHFLPISVRERQDGGQYSANSVEQPARNINPASSHAKLPQPTPTATRIPAQPRVKRLVYNPPICLGTRNASTILRVRQKPRAGRRAQSESTRRVREPKAMRRHGECAGQSRARHAESDKQLVAESPKRKRQVQQGRSEAARARRSSGEQAHEDHRHTRADL